MDAATLLIPAAFAFLTGILFLGYLVVHPLRMASYLLFTSVMVSASAVAVALGFWGDWMGGAMAYGVSFASFISGYIVMSVRVLSADQKRIIPPIRRHKGDPGLGHTAVVYFTHGESPTYTPINWIKQFREFDEQGIHFIPWLLRPFFLYNLRKSYLKVGKSDHHMMHALRLREIEQEYRRRGDETTKFYLGFLDYHPHPDEAAIQALNEGASRIILAEVFVTQSNHTLEGEEMVEALHLGEFGTRVFFTKPLWDSALMHRMFVDRANAVLDGTPREEVGVLLVGHGQPDEWDIEFPSETQQETAFREGIKRTFVDAGYKAENVTSAWMEFKEPKPSKKIGELVANGVERILVFSVSISAEAIHSQCDVPNLVRRAKVPEDTFIINMGAWDNNPLVIRAIMERIDEVARKD